MTVFTRTGNVWRMVPLPCVTVKPAGGVWEARCCGKPVPCLPKSGSGVMVMASVYKYFDERVELYAYS